MNVKKGDIAIVTKGRHEGKIVTVLRPWLPGDLIDGKLWVNPPPELFPYWFVEASSVFVHYNGRTAKRGPVADAWLRPVSGLPDADADEVSTPKNALAKVKQ